MSKNDAEDFTQWKRGYDKGCNLIIGKLKTLQHSDEFHQKWKEEVLGLDDILVRTIDLILKEIEKDVII